LSKFKTFASSNEMKRENNLIEKIADLDNLRLAFWKARKAKEHKQEVLEYSQNTEKNLLKLEKQISTGEIKVGNYHFFKIYDPKERQICAASFAERVLHHAIMNVCHQNFDNFQIEDSYATRLGKGQYKAIEKAIKFTNENKYFVKLDARKYFDNIDHQTLKQLLRHRFKDQKLLTIFDKIIDSYSVKPCEVFKTSQGLGIPIGNLTSQYFANYYLAFADRYAKQELKLKNYVRYMDDIVIWENDKTVLNDKLKLFSNYLKSELLINLKPQIFNHTANGLSFLGYQLLPGKIKLSQKSKKRFFRKLKLYFYKLNANIWTQQQFQIHVLPLFAFVQKAETEFLRQQYLQLFEGNSHGFEPS